MQMASPGTLPGIVLLLAISLFCASAATQNATVNEPGHDGSTEEESHGEPLPEVTVVELRFEEIEVIIIVVGFIMAVVLAKILWHSPILEKVANNIPESCMLIVFGVFTGGIIVASFKLNVLNQLTSGELTEVDIGPCQTGASSPITFSSHLFFQFLLPPIVLESGYFLNKGLFFRNLSSILVFAFFGTLFNALAVGACVYGVGLTGILRVEWMPAAALLFGVITSAVDPVAVLAVFEEIHVGPILHILVFGESLLNDAVTVVLFNLLSVFADKQGLGEEITGIDIGLGIAQFLVVIIVSVLIGIIVGIIAAGITRFSGPVHVLEPAIVWAMGYLAYLLADGFALSGIISLIVCAMVMRHYMEPNLSHKSVTTIKYSLKVISNVSEAVIFLFLGISLYESRSADPVLIVLCILFCLVFRPLATVALSLLLNLVRQKKIGWKEQLIMVSVWMAVEELLLKSYSGLRGAVAFSLALLRFTNLTEESGSEPSENECLLREQQVTAILTLTIFTVFVQGTTIKPLVRLINVRLASTQKETLNESVHTAAIDHITTGVEEITGQIGANTLKEKFLEFDAKYIRPLLERYPNSVDHHILNTFVRLQYKDSHKVVENNYVFEETDEGVVRLEAAEEKKVEAQPVQAAMPGRQLSLDISECDIGVPALDEIMSYSFANPHADHKRNTLSFTDREHACDHRFEPIQHHRTKVQRRLRKRYKKRTQSKSPTSPGSLLRVFRPSSRGELPIVTEEELDDVISTPPHSMPTKSGYAGPLSSPREVQVTVEMADRPIPTSAARSSTLPFQPDSLETEV